MPKFRNRNISANNLMEIYKFLENFEPQNNKDKRDLAILTYAYKHNMSGRQIAKLDDKILTSCSNHNKKGRLTETSINRIIKSYNLEHEKRIDWTKRNNYKRRNKLQVEISKMKRIKVCSCCGSKENLELHHIMPIYLGGNDEYYNLAYVCHDCHRKMHVLIETIFDKFAKSRNHKN